MNGLRLKLNKKETPVFRSRKMVRIKETVIFQILNFTRMKKRFIWLSGIILVLLALTPKPENRLTGIWELQMDGASTGLLKLYNADGTTTNIGLGNDGFGISMEGSYALQSANSYLEKTVRSAFPEQVGAQKLVQFRLTGDSLLHLSYKISGETYTEDYKRLQLISGQ